MCIEVGVGVVTGLWQSVWAILSWAGIREPRVDVLRSVYSGQTCFVQPKPTICVESEKKKKTTNKPAIW